MPPTTLTHLTTVSQALLDAVVDILDTTDAMAPQSQFLAAARPAFDCEFVAVEVTRIAEETTSPLASLETKLRNRFGNMILVTFVVYVVRCTTPIINGQLPTDAAKSATAATVQQDGWALWNGMRAQQETIFDGCTGVYFDYGVPIEEQGGYVGWAFEIRATLEGYE